MYNYKKRVGLFGGIYNNIARSINDIDIQTYPEEILNEYGNIPNLLWLKDGIEISTQRKWNIGYDVDSQRITLPIRTPTGEIMAIKGRANFELSEFEPKYLYLKQGPMSQTLFGFSENYDSLYDGDILIFESEKSILKLDSWGYNNAVALGSNSLSTTQAKLLMSLNPKSITFMLDNSLPFENTKRNAEVLNMLKKVGLSEDYYDRKPSQLSGGQRQRICIARALSVKPQLVVCDEPVSALDVSIQAQIINLLKELQRSMNLTYLFISHDLSVVKFISDKIGVMYLGSMVEFGNKKEIFSNPLHPYTKALFSAIPNPNPDVKMNRIVLKGDIPSPANPPKGCRFHTRCPHATEICKHVTPTYKEYEEGHFAACHRIGEI